MTCEICDNGPSICKHRLEMLRRRVKAAEPSGYESKDAETINTLKEDAETLLAEVASLGIALAHIRQVSDEALR